MATSGGNKEISFTKKVWIAGGIFASICVFLLLLQATFSVILLTLAGILIAVFFRGLSSLMQDKTKWNENLCLAISIVGTLLLIIGLFWLIGAKVQSQIAQLSDTLPETVENAKARLSENPLGKKVVDKVSSPDTMQKAQALAGKFFQTTFGVFGDVYIVLFLGIFFTISPLVYENGIVALVPKNGKDQAGELLNKTAEHLKKWLKGKMISMFVVFLLSAIGLAIIGIPMWLVLALIAGLLSFIPNFGPLIAIIPAVLIGLMQGPVTAALVAGLYILIQVVESNFITPLVQKKLINMPPALIIMAQLFVAPLTGGWGLVLATPLVVILIVFVQELYVKKQEA